jgi:hypothetical protein
MHRKAVRKLMFLVAVLLMLLAIWAYVASLDDSEPLDQSLTGETPAQLETAAPR